MELKEDVGGAPDSRWRFQSHLYGIESRCGGDTGQRQAGFNRTFMELKDVEKNGVALVERFQSHLYGIERNSCGRN